MASKPRLTLVSAFDSVFPLGAIGCANSPQIQAEINPAIVPKNTPFLWEITLPFSERKT
jgi:hypothetical protein